MTTDIIAIYEELGTLRAEHISHEISSKVLKEHLAKAKAKPNLFSEGYIDGLKFACLILGIPTNE